MVPQLEEHVEVLRGKAGGAYLDSLAAHINSIVDEGTTVDVIGLDPPANQVHAITELRCGVQVIKNAIQAEKEGYDAFVIGHFQDAGLMEAKACVDIPVMGLGETTMLYACTLGTKLGLVTIDPVFIRWHQKQIADYGLEERVLGVHAIGAGATELITCVLAMQRGEIPPTINLHEPDPELDLDYVPNEVRRIPVHCCLSNSFGFGGQNDTLIVRRPAQA